MAGRVNQTQFALLGLLSLEPMSGYDLKQLISWSVGYFWQEGYGQIYPTLRELEKQRLVSRRAQKQKGKPERNVYSLTEAGQERLQQWLALPARPEVPRNELLLKLFFGARVSAAVCRTHLEERREHCRQGLKEYDSIRKRLDAEEKQPPDRSFWDMTLSYGEHLARAQLAWCEESLRKLKGRE